MEDIAFYINPFTGNLETMPTEMIAAYAPYESDLNLSMAAECALIRDQEEANNLILSIEGDDETTAQLSTVAR